MTAQAHPDRGTSPRPPAAGQLGGRWLALTCIAIAQLMVALDSTTILVRNP